MGIATMIRVVSRARNKIEREFKDAFECGSRQQVELGW